MKTFNLISVLPMLSLPLDLSHILSVNSFHRVNFDFANDQISCEMWTCGEREREKRIRWKRMGPKEIKVK